MLRSCANTASNLMVLTLLAAGNWFIAGPSSLNPRRTAPAGGSNVWWNSTAMINTLMHQIRGVFHETRCLIRCRPAVDSVVPFSSQMWSFLRRNPFSSHLGLRRTSRQCRRCSRCGTSAEIIHISIPQVVKMRGGKVINATFHHTPSPCRPSATWKSGETPPLADLLESDACGHNAPATKPNLQ